MNERAHEAPIDTTMATVTTECARIELQGVASRASMLMIYLAVYRDFETREIIAADVERFADGNGRDIPTTASCTVDLSELSPAMAEGRTLPDSDGLMLTVAPIYWYAPELRRVVAIDRGVVRLGGQLLPTSCELLLARRRAKAA